MKLTTKIVIIVALPILALAIYVVFQGLVTKKPDSMQDSVSAKSENTVVATNESSTSVADVKSGTSIDNVQSEKTSGNVSPEAAMETLTPELLMDRIKSYKAMGKTRKIPSTLQIIQNGQTLSEVINRIGDPQGLFELKDTDTIFLYYTGDLKVQLENGRVVNLSPEFNDKLKQAVFGTKQKHAIQTGTWNKMKKRGRLMKGKITSLLRKFKSPQSKSTVKPQS